MFVVEPKRTTKLADGKGRLALGSEVAGKYFQIEPQPDGTILLRPMALIPEDEAWIYEDKRVYEKLKRGNQQAEKGQVRERSFLPEDEEA
ncbi:MAG: hypothetical protein ACOCX1_04770 [Fimbriimonadaceae bacterium]